MKQLISLIFLLALLAACGDTAPEAGREGILDATAASAISYSITNGQSSVNAGIINNDKEGTDNASSWQPANRWNPATKYPMTAIIDLGGVYEVKTLEYYVGNRDLEASKDHILSVSTSLNSSFSNPKALTTLTPQNTFDKYISKSVTGEARFLKLSFASAKSIFNISELKVYGERTVAPPTPPNPNPPTAGKVYRDVLGMNFTWASDQLVGTLKPDGKIEPKTDSAKIASSVRWFLLGSKDYPATTPGTSELQVCNNIVNVWSCPEVSPRQNLERIVRLSKEFTGQIFLAPEDAVGRTWPGKSWTAAELTSGKTAKQSGFEYADAYLKTLEYLDNTTEARVVLAMTNEEWLRTDADGRDRKAAYDEYRRGFVQAHKDHVSRGGKVKIATGARQMDNRSFDWVKPNSKLTESIADLPADVLDYVNSVGGYTSIHIHDRNGDGFEGNVSQSYGVKQLRAMRQWLNTNGYSNIKIYVGELSFTVSKNDELPKTEQLPKDAAVLKDFVREAAKTANPVILYQVDDHWPKLEGKFTGTSYGVRLATWLVEFAKEAIR